MRIVLLVISFSVICSALFAATVPAPLAISNLNLGGGDLNQYTPGVTGGTGLNNIGLLVKCWGRVTAIDTADGKFFYISDRSRGIDPSGVEGIRVSITDLAAGNTIAMPTVGQFLDITGISSTSAVTTTSGTSIIPTLRPRNQQDVHPLPF